MDLGTSSNRTMRSDRLSLRQRLLLWLLPPILMLTCLWIWATYSIVLHFTNFAYDQALEDSVHTLAGQVQIENGRIKVNLPPAARQMLEFDQIDKVYFSVSDIHNNLFVGNHVLPPSPGRHTPIEVTRFYDLTIDGQPVRLAEYQMPGETLGNVLYVRVAETLHKREILAREALAYMVSPQLIFLAGIVLFVWYGVGHGMAPLRRIRDAISNRSHEDLTPLDETGLPAEVHEQVHVINGLMSRLGKTIAAQRRFIADATHQLRTPITVVRTQTELALRTTDPEALLTTVRTLDSATARLTRLANQLLNLSRAETGLEGSLDFVSIDITSVVEDVVAGLVPSALKKQIDIRVEIPNALPEIQGDQQLLSEMLANLIDNAIRYIPVGSSIDVRVKESGEQVMLVVVDDGPGIPEQERQKALERFYRGNTVTSEGSGLGLAIAHEIVTLHGGKMRLDSAPGHPGLMVTIELPCRHH